MSDFVKTQLEQALAAKAAQTPAPIIVGAEQRTAAAKAAIADPAAAVVLTVRPQAQPAPASFGAGVALSGGGRGSKATPVVVGQTVSAFGYTFRSPVAGAMRAANTSWPNFANGPAFVCAAQHTVGAEQREACVIVYGAPAKAGTAGSGVIDGEYVVCCYASGAHYLRPAQDGQ